MCCLSIIYTGVVFPYLSIFIHVEYSLNVVALIASEWCLTVLTNILKIIILSIMFHPITNEHIHVCTCMYVHVYNVVMEFKSNNMLTLC